MKIFACYIQFLKVQLLLIYLVLVQSIELYMLAALVKDHRMIEGTTDVRSDGSHTSSR